jgi:hypothetical protein
MNGQKLKLMTVVDAFTREGLVIEVDRTHGRGTSRTCGMVCFNSMAHYSFSRAITVLNS